MLVFRSRAMLNIISSLPSSSTSTRRTHDSVPRQIKLQQIQLELRPSRPHHSAHTKGGHLPSMHCFSNMLLLLLMLLSVDNPNHSNDIQTEFDIFYSKMINLLNHFYRIRTVTVSSRDPDFITPAIKTKLRRKNRLMRTGRVEEAEAIAKRITQDITKCNQVRLSHINSSGGTKDIWKAVRELTVTGHERQPCIAAGVSAESLNNHYASISTDTQYQTSERMPATANDSGDYISEWEVFNLLNRLRPTAPGLDQLPA